MTRLLPTSFQRKNQEAFKQKPFDLLPHKVKGRELRLITREAFEEFLSLHTLILT